MSALYVFDPGPEGSIGDVSWVAARQSGKVSLLIYQGVLMTDLARAADIVLPGSAWVEKDGTYTNDQGRVQAAARVFAPPGDALDDREIFLRVGTALGSPLAFQSATQVREAIADALAEPRLREPRAVNFARPVTAKHWLQASNPSERWKWDFLFQEVNEQKWDGLSAALPQLNIIPLTPVQDAPKNDGD